MELKLPSDLDYDDVDSDAILSEFAYTDSSDCSNDSFILFLDEDDIHDVKEQVLKLRTNYYNFGMALGISLTDMDDIKEKHKDSTEALSSVLLTWLKQNYNTTKHGLPTWRKLVEAVDSGGGGNNHAQAKIIAKQHPSTGNSKARRSSHHKGIVN